MKKSELKAIIKEQLLKEEDTSPQAIANEMNKKLKFIGFERMVRVEASDIKDDVMNKIATLKPSIALCGIVSPMFKKIEIDVTVGANIKQGIYIIELNYQYTHPDGGTNGKRVRMKYDSDTKNWVIT